MENTSASSDSTIISQLDLHQEAGFIHELLEDKELEGEDEKCR